MYAFCYAKSYRALLDQSFLLLVKADLIPQNSQKATTRVTRRCFCERKCLLDLTFHKSSFT
ncbi:hypothetical protein B0178_02700 [Streptococcus pseudopneumoniae]|nr:hypothetical protein B0177_01245 [Streptococcus pseudopneumoniae]OOR86502.1 hypothetical protein B0178_02700 [Streptococcus pseudopneumoniae]ORC41236.1 hypothetical protein B4W83_03590 [Streptococcus pseudopneumoniae ATCC BAA-960 = CCUG 49455]